MSVEQKIRLHSKLYSYADKLLKKHNPCKIEKGKCICGAFCCSGCKYLTANGCSVKCLWCKLWLCHCLRQQHEYRPLILKLARIRRVAFKYRLIIERGSEEDLTKRLHRTEANKENRTKVVAALNRPLMTQEKRK